MVTRWLLAGSGATAASLIPHRVLPGGGFGARIMAPCCGRVGYVIGSRPAPASDLLPRFSVVVGVTAPGGARGGPAGWKGRMVTRWLLAGSGATAASLI